MRRFELSSPIVIDTDCLSSFLWVEKGFLVPRILKQPIFVPEPVILEISELLRHRQYAWVPKQLDELIASGKYQRLQFTLTDPATAEYATLIRPTRGKQLGYGEASVLAYVRFHGGTVASNNLSDIAPYSRKHSIEFISTDDILCIGVKERTIEKGQASELWEAMKARQRLPKHDFPEAYRRFCENLPRSESTQKAVSK